MKWYLTFTEDGQWGIYRTAPKYEYPAAVIFREPDLVEWAVYGRNDYDCVAEGKHTDLTQAQIEAEKALKKWMGENE